MTNNFLILFPILWFWKFWSKTVPNRFPSLSPNLWVSHLWVSRSSLPGNKFRSQSLSRCSLSTLGEMFPCSSLTSSAGDPLFLGSAYFLAAMSDATAALVWFPSIGFVARCSVWCGDNGRSSTDWRRRTAVAAASTTTASIRGASTIRRDLAWRSSAPPPPSGPHVSLPHHRFSQLPIPVFRRQRPWRTRYLASQWIPSHTKLLAAVSPELGL